MGVDDSPEGSAREQLRVAEQARRRAAAPRPMPRFLAPAAGVLMAAGFVWFAVAVRHPGQSVYLVAGIGCLLAFLGLVVVAGRAGGIVGRPGGRLDRRVAFQAVALLPFALGGVAAIFFGLAGFLVVAGVGLGVVAAVQMHRAHRAPVR